MRKCIIAQLKILKNRPLFHFSMLTMLTVSFVSFLINVINYYGTYMPDTRAYRDVFIGNKYGALSSIVVIILPIVCVLPFCDSYLEDKKKNRLPVILQNCSRKEYFLSKYLVSGIAGFTTVFIPLLFNLIMNVIAFPAESAANVFGGASNQNRLYAVDGALQNFTFKALFIEKPFLYCFIFIIFMSLFACAGALFAYSLSYIIKQRTMIIVPFFLVSTLTDVLAGSLRDIFNVPSQIKLYLLSDYFYGGANYVYYFALLAVLLCISAALAPIGIKRLGDIV